MINDGHTVWILGAGFSKSLGGPLLADLFRQEYPLDLQELVGTERAERLTWVQTLFNYGRDKEHLWENAEDFLAYVDDAYGHPPGVKKAKLARIVYRVHYAALPGATNEVLAGSRFAPYMTDLRPLVRWALAAESSRFLDLADIEDEKWRPYREWARTLNAEKDTIVTFNYDRVLEKIGAGTIVAPTDPSLKGGGRPIFKQVPVFKLHGSTDWTGESDVDFAIVDGDPFKEDRTRAIAAPGRSKSSWSNGFFAPLWRAALQRMEVASSIAILGYGFPKTDAEARMQLLSAIDRADSGPTKQIELVLGPDTNRPESQRVLELVRHRAGISRRVFVDRNPERVSSSDQVAVITQHRLWAEDFVGDCDRRTRHSRH